MSSQSTPPTADLVDPQANITTVDQAYAVVFLQDLATNKQMSTQWTALLAQLKADSTVSPAERVVAVDNFLSGWGYETTGADVLGLVKAPWWTQYQATLAPNAASDRFVQDVIQDTTLYKGYTQALSAAQAAQKLDPLDAWLQAQGYACSSSQVMASFHKMRDQNMNYWTGIYGTTTMAPTAGGAPAAGPALIIYGDTGVSVGGVRIYDPSYSNGVLTWGPTSADKAFTNPCTGSITFSTITMPLTSDAQSYVGNEFTGTLDYEQAAGPYQGEYTFSGRIGTPAPNTPGHVTTPPSYDSQTIAKIFQYINYFVMAHMAISALAALPGQLKEAGEWLKGKFGQRAAAEESEASTEAAEADASPAEMESAAGESAYTESTELSELEAESTSVDPAEIASEEAEVASAEEAYEDEMEAEATGEAGGEGEDEGGFADDLGDVLEDV